jgi:hypothetical protein
MDKDSQQLYGYSSLYQDDTRWKTELKEAYNPLVFDNLIAYSI